MKDKTPVSLSEHMTKARKARWAKTNSEERSAHAKMMVEAREAKRKAGRVTAETKMLPLTDPFAQRAAAGMQGLISALKNIS